MRYNKPHWLGFLLVAVLVVGMDSAVWSQSSSVSIEQIHERAMKAKGEEEGVNSRIRTLESEGFDRSDVLALRTEGLNLPYSSSGHYSGIYQRGGGNTGKTVQSGSSHLAILVQRGDYNRTRINQRGSAHSAGVRLVGDNNSFQLEQGGSNHLYILNFEGSGLSHNVSQYGHDNTLVQVGSGSTSFNVKQKGNGSKMIIRHQSP